MKNADMPANPTVEIHTGVYGDCLTSGSMRLTSNGLTKREMFAMHAMQGITSNEFGNYTGANWSEDIAKEAVKLADALLAELEK